MQNSSFIQGTNINQQLSSCRHQSKVKPSKQNSSTQVPKQQSLSTEHTDLRGLLVLIHQLTEPKFKLPAP